MYCEGCKWTDYISLKTIGAFFTKFYWDKIGVPVDFLWP